MANRDTYWMGLALELARRGQGRVEPNPMVGCVVVCEDRLIASGYHQAFGGPHAEVHAWAQCDPKRIASSTIYVTLEPCSHFGKTPPCVEMILKSPPKRIVIAMLDPFPEVAGRGIRQLQEAGIQVDVGVMQSKASELNAPYLKRLKTGMPWTIAKWAMTLDGAIATREGHSQWISNESSRLVAHRIRNRVDSVIIGIGTALADDPSLTVRLPDDERIRSPARVVIDRHGRLPLESILVRSAGETRTIVVTCEDTPLEKRKRLEDAGCEIVMVPRDENEQALRCALKALGARGQTNVLIEGGGTLLGAAFDDGLVDEIHCFIAPKVIGGHDAVRPVAGRGKSSMHEAITTTDIAFEKLGQDIYLSGRINPL